METSESNGRQPAFFSSQVEAARRFYLDLAPATDTTLAVVCGGCESCRADYAIHRSEFPYYSIEFVARGSGRLVLAGRRFALRPGTVFSYGPTVSQDIVTDSAEMLVKYFVDFAGMRARSLLRRHGLAPGSVVNVSAPGEIQDVFDRLIRDGLSAGGLSTELCASLLDYLILKITESRTPGQARHTPAYATYRRCRQYIQTHFACLKTLRQAAHECHVDQAYLCRLFRRYDHQTPYQFLQRLKMNLAAERLQDVDVLVKQVAAELGFADTFHFSRAFKRVFGRSPEAFRQLR